MNRNFVRQNLTSVMNRSEIMVIIKSRDLIILHALAIKKNEILQIFAKGTVATD